MNEAKLTFNKGRLSPKIDSRVDYEGYDGGCRQMDNMIPTQYGVAERRPGTVMIAGGTSVALILSSIVAIDNTAVCYENEVVVNNSGSTFDTVVCSDNAIVCFENKVVGTASKVEFLATIVCYENKVVFYENDVVFN